MNTLIRSALLVAGMVVAAQQATAQVVFYEHEGFEGRSFTTERQIRNLDRFGFNDRASSMVVLHDRWEVCQDSGFNGQCIVLRPGRYSSLAAMGLNDRVSSVRMVNNDTRIDDDRYAPPPEAVYDNHRRRSERLYEADVTSVHAVVGPPEQRCWMEREQAVEERSGPNVPGAILGAVIGGVLGHQIGGGRGKDVATAGGAVVGGAIGAHAGGDRQQSYTQDVQHCESVSTESRPAYWDVTYVFRGQEHRMQVTTPPGSRVTVNRDGEPRA